MAVKDSLDNEIISGLIKEGTVTQEKINELLANHNNRLESLKSSLFSKIYSIDILNKQLLVLNSSFKEISKIELGGIKEKFSVDEWESWGSGVIIFDQENKKTGDFYTNLNENYGIAFSEKGTFLYNPTAPEQKYLVQLERYIFNAVPKNKTENFPFDLSVSRDKNLLCLIDRGAGTIYLIDTKTDKLLKTLPLRTPGSNKALNVAISIKRNQLFVTDNQSTTLTVINLQTFETESKNPGLGVLGNILLDPQEDNLYCVVTKPKPILKLIDLSNFSAGKEFPLKGDLYSTGDIPYDLLTISPDCKSVYLMTHIPEPNPFTPVITVIDAERAKAVQRFSIKDGTMPTNIGFKTENPVFSQHKSVIELLLDNRVADEARVEEIRNDIIRSNQIQNNPFISNSETFEVNAVANEIPAAPTTGNFGGQQAEKKKEEVVWQIAREPQKIGFANISPGIDTVLYNKCREKILKDFQYSLEKLSYEEAWEEKEIEVEKRFKAIAKALDKKDSMPAIRLTDAISKARQELEWYDVGIIRLAGLLEGYNFEFAFEREEVLEMIRMKERDELIETGLKTIPTNCPNCEAPLLGSYICRMCGFELEKPEDALKRKLLQIATYDPFENLKQGHLMILDIKHHRIFEIDHFRKVTWQIQKDVLHSDVEVELDLPRDAVRLKNKITLVVDYGASRVFKITEKGRLYWELNYEFHPDNKLNKPVSASALESGNIIIVDRDNHRVIEVDEDHEIRWSYGQKGIQGIGENMLHCPNYFQRTAGGTNIITDTNNHRVIELGEKKKIIWQYGNEENSEGPEAAGNGPGKLNAPLSAWRFNNENTLILDAGNLRVIEVNKDKEIIWEYKTDEGDENTRILNPVRVYYIKASGKILIVGEDKVVEVDHDADKKVSWYCTIEELVKSASSGEDDTITVMKENVTRTKVKHGVTSLYTKRASEETPEEKERKERLKAIMEGKRADMAGRSASILRSPVMLTPGAQVDEAQFFMVDKAKGDLYRVDRKGLHTWYYPASNGLAKPQFVQELEDSILVADSENKRVIELDKASKAIKWSYEGSADEKLAYPKTAELTAQDTVLIADQLGNKVIEINKKTKETVWAYKGLELLKTPYYASRLAGGNTLIIDWSSHIVFEVTPAGETVWSYGVIKKPGRDGGCLSYPEYAERLKNGNTLIVDTRNSRVIEVSTAGEITWEYEGQGINKIMSPTFAKRFDNGNTVIYHSNNRYILEVDPQGKPLWKYTHYEKRV